MDWGHRGWFRIRALKDATHFNYFKKVSEIVGNEFIRLYEMFEFKFVPFVLFNTICAPTVGIRGYMKTLYISVRQFRGIDLEKWWQSILRNDGKAKKAKL